jgi:xanthine dehydrogenase accessory factor
VFERLVVVRGGGDLGSGTALRLWRAGFPVAILEQAAPIAVRRTVSLSEAVYEGEVTVEEAVASLVKTPHDALSESAKRTIPVLVDPDMCSLPELQPFALVDATLAKRNTGLSIYLAPCVVALGPGFTAGADCHAVVETNRGADLGRVIWRGRAEPNTGSPGNVAGRTVERVLRAPASGRLRALRSIGTLVKFGDGVAEVDGGQVVAPFDGLVRGLVRDGIWVQDGMKIGDIDPRPDPSLCLRVSDKSLAVAGGVLEAVLMMLKESGP